MNNQVSEYSNKNQGLIFKIQRYSIQDGPGIRTTVFLKGCPLDCQWCSNPESQKSYPEIMVRPQLCQQCLKCVETCENSAISQVNGVIQMDRDLCQLCMSCVENCPSGSLEITGESISIDKVITECSRDELFYKNSGGGITLSGGEPLSQPEFAINFLQKCKEKALNTALDTSGYAKWEVMEKVLEYTDVILFDLKHLDPDFHYQGTQVKNRAILENLKKAAESKLARIWIRIPVIKDYNDSKEYMQTLAKTIKEIRVEKISLLNYHEWGKPKYMFLGREYPLNGLEAIDEKKLEDLKSIMESEGVPVTIGY